MFWGYSFAVLLSSVCRGKKYSFDVDTTCSWKMLEIELRYSCVLWCAGCCEWIVLSTLDMAVLATLQNPLFAADKQK